MATKLSDRDRFWGKVKMGDPSQCWPWQASKNWRGVGFFSMGGRHNLSAPRVCWEFTRGAIPTGMHVLHTCDNPSCVNPDHIYLGNHTDNMRDKSARGRARRGFEHRKRLTDQEVKYAIALRRDRGWTWASLGRYFSLPYQTVRRRVLKEEAGAKN